MSAAVTRSPALASTSGPLATSRAPSGRRWAVGSRGAIAHGLILNILLPVGSIGLAMLLRPYLPAPDRHSYDGSTGTFVREVVRAILGVGLFCGIGLLVVGRLRWRDLGWRDLSLRQVALGCAGFLATAAVFAAFLLTVTDYTSGGLLAEMASFTWRQRLLGLAIGINASLVEESLYRGYLQPSLCKRLGTTGGIVTTAVLFSLMHVPTNLVAFGTRLIIGLGLGILRGQDRPLWAPAIAHTLIWVVIFAL